MSRRHKKFCTTLNYIEHFLILTSIGTESISISALGSLPVIPIGITSSEIGLKISAITAGIKKYRSIIKKKKKKHDKIKQYKSKQHKSLKFKDFNRFSYYS